ncbi:MAG: glycoside hydrolase [Iodobacter sp.]
MRFLLLFALSPLAQALTLQNSDWQINIDPATLATQAKLPHGTELPLSSAGPAAGVSKLTQEKNQASWLRKDGVNVTAILNGTVLSMKFSRDSSGRINWPLIPPGAKGLLLPLFEGSYIPTQDKAWRKALANEYSGINTTEGLSLPALGLDYGPQVISVLFANPFNNQLNFKPGQEGIGIAASHDFTSLDFSRPYEVQIALNGSDWLAPAKRYRQWSQDNGQFVSLKEKLAAAPDGEKLIGASHVYVWGQRLLSPSDVRDWAALRQALLKAPKITQDNAGLKALLAKELPLNSYQKGQVLNGLEDSLKKILPGTEASVYKARKAWVIQYLGKALNNPQQWGEGTSAKMIAALEKAALPRLWIGLPQWEAGFANPEAIAAARKAGYLIGPYDSYDTALPDGNTQPEWSSAQLGQDAFLRCGIMQKDGRLKKGFQGNGVYVNQACVRPLLEKRVPAIQAASPYNSWFLDVAATGVIYDDYDPAKPTSEAQDLANRNAGVAWIRQKLGVIVGSEDGHAVANSQVAFAHGMQTRGFGWLDADMRKNTASPYYLGRWFPNNQPEFFFKTVSIKPEYQALFFNPATRVPLFQAAFHDSLITTHHWTLDSLKFKQTRAATELMQQLYNVPPLLNLSLETNTRRLPYLQQMDAFFRPLHQRLAYQALTGFSWKNKEGSVQETRFSDGTRLIANFGSSAFMDDKRSIAPLSILAVFPDGKTLGFQSPKQP